MKHTFKVFGILVLLAGMVLSGCVKDEFDKPDVPNPCDVKSGFTPNITIQGIGEMFGSLETVQGSQVRIFPDTNLVLSAKVVSSDKAGNFYKVLYLQDATGALSLSIEGSSLFNDYPVGQMVHLNLSGLTLEFDEWVSIHEIGMGTFEKDGTIKGIGRIPVSHLSSILKNEGCPTELSPISMDLNANSLSNLGKLVKIEDVQFAATDTAKTYADSEANPPQSANLTIEDCDGNSLVLRSSGYASFASKKVPNGKGSIMGIYTKYGTTYQLIIRDTEDVQFTEARCGDNGGGGGANGDGTFDSPYDISYVLAHPSGNGIWVQGFLVGVKETDVDPFVDNFNPPFRTQTNVYIAPTADETNPNKMLIVQLPNNAVRSQTNLKNNASLLGKEVKYYGNVKTYFGVTGLKGTTGYWLIDSDTGIDPEAPVEVTVNGTSQVVTSINETFEGGTSGSAWAQNGWLTANVKGERNFISKSYGEGDNANSYVQATGYGATASELEMWLVTPGVNCEVNKQFSFESKMGYWKHNGLTVYVSTNFDGNNANLMTANWTDITSEFTIPTEPANGYGESFVPSGNYDLSSYTGQTVYFLFKYTGNNSTNTTSVQIDNVKVSDL